LRSIRKIKIHYLEAPRKMKLNEFPLPLKTEVGGDMTARFDANGGRLVSLCGTESRATLIAGQTVSRTDVTLRLGLLRSETLSRAALTTLRQSASAREKSAPEVALSAVTSEAERESALERSELGGATLESLLDELSKAEASTDGQKSFTRLYLKFKALIFIRPESSENIGRVLTSAAPGGATMRVLAEALGAVGHTRAQEALVSAIRARPDDWPALAILIPALGTLISPTDKAEQTLRELANSSRPEIASTAQLSLGIMARDMSEDAPERAARIVEWASHELESAPSAEAKRQMLLVLGNAGSARSLPAVASYLRDPEPTLRAAAASALRWIPPGEADRLLLTALASDADADVRLEAAIALGLRATEGANFAVQKQVFFADGDVKVRLAVLRNLWKARESFPEARRLVREAAAKDTAAAVRKAAAEIIADNPNDYFKQ
jgi:HEAT repeat protein